MDLVVRALSDLQDRSVEVVERKGLGHPDTICDAVAESVSLKLCRFYQEKFGAILHHNVDKVLLRGGTSKARFGEGEVLGPIEIYISGRATSEFKDITIPITDLAVEACSDWLKMHIPSLSEKHVKIIPLLRPGSSELTGLFLRRERKPLCNDTACGTGFAPFTDLERLVLEAERKLNYKETKLLHPDMGQDIKIIGIRSKSKIRLIVSCAFISRFVTSIEDYIEKKNNVAQILLATSSNITSDHVDVIVNAADDLDRGQIFLTVTGTSAEAGDDGEAGRGNRANGLITPYRPMALEAVAGKNPVSHVGKLYNLIAPRIAADIAKQIKNTAVNCVLVSEIGRPIEDPLLADVQLGLPAGKLSKLEPSVREIVVGHLANLSVLSQSLIDGRLDAIGI